MLGLSMAEPADRDHLIPIRCEGLQNRRELEPRPLASRCPVVDARVARRALLDLECHGPDGERFGIDLERDGPPRGRSERRASALVEPTPDQDVEGSYSGPASLQLGDFDGNLYPDTILTDRYRDVVVILYSTGSGRFFNFHGTPLPQISQFDLNASYAAGAVVAADLDGDGALDFAAVKMNTIGVGIAPAGRSPVMAPIGDQTIVAGETLALWERVHESPTTTL